MFRKTFCMAVCTASLTAFALCAGVYGAAAGTAETKPAETAKTADSAQAVKTATTATKLENPENVKGYLFAYFRGERGSEWEQIYLAVSKDGLKWQALNDSKPVLQSTEGEGGVRDPFIIRNPENDKIFLIATDLCIGKNGDWSRAQYRGSKAIIVWESSDLINWSKPRRVEVAVSEAGCTWAPEAFWDSDRREFLVFWASMTPKDGKTKQIIYSSRTKDFKNFSPAGLYIEKTNHIIDTTIVKDKGNYYRFSKDESSKAIIMETATSLAGPWKDVPGFQKLQGYEGPECFRLNDGTGRWCLLLDYYSKGQGYKPFVTDDLASGKFVPAEDLLKFPHRFRHGSILPLTQQEYDALVKQWGIGKQE